MPKLGPQSGPYLGHANPRNVKSRDCSLKFELVMGHAYTNVADIHAENDDLTWMEIEKCLQSTISGKERHLSDFGADDLSKRKTELIELLRKYRLPVEADGDIVVALDGLVTIKPPYLSDSCSSKNCMVLGRIRKLIISAPDTQVE